MNKSPIDRHRETAKKILKTPDYPWHKRQTRLHNLVSSHGIVNVCVVTGFSQKTVQVYLSYKPFDLPADSNAINESRLLKAENELK